MIQLRILSGPNAGTDYPVSAFPFLIGRGAAAHLRLMDPGVWERHARIDWVQPDRLTIQSLPDAILRVNSQPVMETALKSGDLLEIGVVKIQFSFAPTSQSSLTLRERLTWVALGILCLLQVLLIYRLLS